MKQGKRGRHTPLPFYRTSVALEICLTKYYRGSVGQLCPLFKSVWQQPPLLIEPGI